MRPSGHFGPHRRALCYIELHYSAMRACGHNFVSARGMISRPHRLPFWMAGPRPSCPETVGDGPLEWCAGSGYDPRCIRSGRPEGGTRRLDPRTYKRALVESLEAVMNLMRVGDFQRLPKSL
jgi:hypothetical protein